MVVFSPTLGYLYRIVTRNHIGRGITASSVALVLASAVLAVDQSAAGTQAPVPRQWQTLVPNGMLNFTSEDGSGPWGWTNETGRGRATWAIEGVDGNDRCLKIDAETGGGETWHSAPFTLQANTEYLISAMFRYGSEQVPGLARMKLVDVATGNALSTGTMPAFGSWQRLRKRILPGEAVEVQVQLVSPGGNAVWFDEIMMMNSDVAVHPQLPEDASVVSDSRPILSWWHEHGTGGRYTVLIAQDPTFGNMAHRFQVQGDTQFVPPVDLPVGTWFWVVLPQFEEPLNEYVHASLSEIRSFSIVKSRGEPADTTPPHLYRMRPALDSTARDDSPMISLKWLERGGSGIDPSSIKVLLDGKAAPALPVINTDGLEVRSGELSAGRHRVDVTLSDKAGNRSHAAWQFYVGQTAPSVTKLDENGWILHNDLFFFPVFHYNYQICGVNMELDGDYPEAGFNMVVNCQNLDRALEYGMKGTQSTGGNSDLETADQLAEKFTEALELCQGGLDHPAYIGMWVGEAWEPKHTRPIFEAFRRIKKDHLMMPVGSGSWQIAHHPIKLIDVPSLDSYPIGADAFTVTIEMFQSLRKLRLPGQGMHLWAQAFDWHIFSHDHEPTFDYQNHFVENDLFGGYVYRPTPRELFAQAALGWINGSQCAGWWGPAAQKFPATREGLKECARRSSWLAPVLRSNSPLKRTVCTTDAQHRAWLARKHDYVYTMEREYAGKRFLIAVNVNSIAAAATFIVPELADDSQVKVLWEDRRLQSVDGVFQDTIPGLGAVVYSY